MSHEQEYYYDAFISYRHIEPDITIAKKLHKSLENYRIPKKIRETTGIKKIGRVFRDQEELPTSGNLSDSIKDALGNSRYLIIICSSNTPKSKWCCEEIEIFQQLRGREHILSLLIEGEPEEAFPHSLRYQKEQIRNDNGAIKESEKEIEPLAADIRSRGLRGMLRKMRVEKLRILAPMLSTTFDGLKQRHKEQRMKRIAGVVVGATAFFAAFGGFSLYQSGVIAKQSEELIKRNAEITKKNEEITTKSDEITRKSVEITKKSDEILRKNEEITKKSNEISRKNTELEHLNQSLVDQINQTERQRDLARKNGDEAVKQANIAKTNERLAIDNERKAIEQKEEVLRSQSLYLADLSGQQRLKGDKIMAAMLALQALPKDLDHPDRPYVLEAEAALRNAVMKNNEGKPTPDIILKQDGGNNCLDVSSTGDKILTGTFNGVVKVWDAVSGKELSLINVETDLLFHAAFCPDESKLVTCSSYGKSDVGEILEIWDIATSRKVTEIKVEHSFFDPPVFSKDGKKVSIVVADREFRTYDVFTGKLLSSSTIERDGVHQSSGSTDFKKFLMQTLEGRVVLYDIGTGEATDLFDRKERLNVIQFSDDSQTAILGYDNGNVEALDVRTGKIIAKRKNNGPIGIIRFTPDQSRIIIASRSGNAEIGYSKGGNQIEVWDLKTQNLLFSLQGHSAIVNSVEFSSDCRRMVSASDDNTARVWDLENGRQLFILRGHSKGVKSAAFAEGDTRIVTASGNEDAAFVWDITDNKNALFISANNKQVNVNDADISPDGRKIVTASEDHTVRIWNITTGKLDSDLISHTGPVHSVRYSPDGRKIVTASYDNTAIIWDSGRGTKILELKGHTSGVHTAQFSPDGKKVVTAATDGSVIVWNSETGKVISSHAKSDRYAYWFGNSESDTDISLAAKFSPDGQRVAAVQPDRTVLIWDTETGKELFKLSGHSNQIIDLNFSPDGKKLVTASWDKTARLWDLETGKELFRLSGHTGTVEAAEFSSLGDKLVTASWDGTAGIWDVKTGQELTRLTGRARFKTASFSPDGSRVVTSSGDMSAIVWDTLTGKELVTLSGHTSYLTLAKFHMDGNQIITASGDGRICIWQFQSMKKVMNEAALMLEDREMTAEEKRQFFIQ